MVKTLVKPLVKPLAKPQAKPPARASSKGRATPQGENPGTASEANPQARILAAARIEFTAHGLAGARMRPIAQRAGVNPALLHYYFRNKEKLYEAALLDTVHSVWGIFQQPNPWPMQADLPALLRAIVHRYFDVVLAHPEFPRFMLREIVDGGRHIPLVIDAVRTQYGPFLNKLTELLQQQMAAGRIRPIEPIDFFLNAGGLILSSVLYALISEHIPGKLAGTASAQPAAGLRGLLNDRDFRERRREEIVTTLFDGLKVVSP